VYVHSITAPLEPAEAARLRTAFAAPRGEPAGRDLSAEGRAILPLLTEPTVDEAASALARLPVAMRERLDVMSPLRYVAGIRAPMMVLLHDRDDVVIPVSESRRLREALSGRTGVRYTEFTVFRHLDPTKGKPSPLALASRPRRTGGRVPPRTIARTLERTCPAVSHERVTSTRHIDLRGVGEVHGGTRRRCMRSPARRGGAPSTRHALRISLGASGKRR
jgi:hypothetical protein